MVGREVNLLKWGGSIINVALQSSLTSGAIYIVEFVFGIFSIPVNTVCFALHSKSGLL